MRVRVRLDIFFREAMFYYEWAKKSKNLKTKRKLLMKAMKEINLISLNKSLTDERMRKALFVKNIYQSTE